ncbi:MAG: serine protease Do [Planctomycetota bacterium]
MVLPPACVSVNNGSHSSLRYLALTVFIFAIWVNPARALESKEIYQLNETSIFQIRVLNRETGKKSSIGSGFVVGDGFRVATNFHVISQIILEPDLYYITYLDKNGDEGELTLLAMDVSRDLALLQSDKKLGEPAQMSELPPRGAPVFAMGNPLDLGLTMAVGTNGGILNQTDDSRILFSGNLNPGMSGGPTFDQQGRVIGINVATSRNAISFIVPSSYLIRLLEKPDSELINGLQDLRSNVTKQVLDYENNYIAELQAQDWKQLSLRNFTLPGVISPTVRCWDNSAKLGASAEYKRFQIRCSNKNHIFLDSDNKFVGRLIYEYYWLESEDLNSVQFHNLYQSLNKDQINSKLDRDVVSNYNCKTWFITVSSEEFKSNLCRREYVEYEGLSDVLFTAALTGKARQGFFITLIMTGVDYQSSLPLIQKFLNNIEWTD